MNYFVIVFFSSLSQIFKFVIIVLSYIFIYSVIYLLLLYINYVFLISFCYDYSYCLLFISLFLLFKDKTKYILWQ